MTTIELRGVDEVQRKLDLLARLVPGAVGAALYQEGQTIQGESMEIVPLDEGILKNSAFTNTPQTDARGTFVTIGYGGAAKAYAVVQHEDLTFRHSPGKTAKYLERPFLARAARVPLSLVSRIRRAWGL